MVAGTRRTRLRRSICIVATVVAIGAVLKFGPPLAFHTLPPAITGEADRLAAVLQLSAGDRLAEIGAGKGALATAMHEHVQPDGLIYVTELDPQRLSQLRARGKLTVIEAKHSTTGLPDGCCEALFMRNVYHHIRDTAGFNKDLLRTLRPGGRLAIIDFEPGTFRLLNKRPTGSSPARSGHGVAAPDIVQELTTAGFRIERIDPNWGGWMFLLVAVAP